jgi:hypothetical protein
MLHDYKNCYNFKKITYSQGLLDEAVDATYIIHLEGNGRYDDILNQLTQFQPTKIVYIVFNKGYKNCQKDKNITLPAHDLVDAFLEIFKHANNPNQNYNNILILEDDYFFNEKINQETNRSNICTFLNNHKNEDFQYLLGCIPFIKIPYSWDFNHYMSLISLGTHSSIYSKKNREELLKIDKINIYDWDIYNCIHSRRYAYKEAVCYQLFPETENSKSWGESNYILFLLAKMVKSLFKILKLDTQIEPGHSFFYIFSKMIFFIILLLLFYIFFVLIYRIYKIGKIKITKNKKPK